MGKAVGAPAYAGVDTHKDTHTLALKDALGRRIGTWEFPATPEGYAALADAIGDPSVPVGVEGTRSYGAGLVGYLRSRGFDVSEVIRPGRPRRGGGKSDALDALAACDSLAAGDAVPLKELEGDVESLRWLMSAREQVVAGMTRTSNWVDSMLVTASPELRGRWGSASGAARMEAIAGSEPTDAAGRVLKSRAESWLEGRKQARELEGEIAGLVARVAPALLGAPCVGAVSAARLVLAAGSNPGRMRSEAAFSMLCGTSPIPASSGKTDRHRLNRGGDRQANRGIHEIARARMAHDPRTQAYIEKKVSEGKSKREAVRCLCRFIAREVFRLLTGPQEPPCDQEGLAARRRRAGLTQAQAAEGAGITRSKLGRLERLDEFDTASLRLYDEFLRSAGVPEQTPEKGLDNI